jgi:Arc/MetJ-type ribon-helix-helix transcriptional regulator
MQIEIRDPALRARVEKHLASGAYADAEDVLRRALDVLDAEETWTEEERQALDEKIGRALAQVEAGNTYGPEEARRLLAARRAAHLASRDR